MSERMRVDWPTILLHPDDVTDETVVQLAEHANVRVSKICPRGKAFRFAPEAHIMGIGYCTDCGQYINRCECIETTGAS